jgi:iron complex outermembrane receptor protein
VHVAGGAAAPLRIEMTTAVVEITPTVVTGAISARSATDVLSPTSVLSGEQLDRQLKGTLAATLQNEPGVSVTTLGPAAARPVIRGFSGDRVVILEDGIRPGDLSAMTPDHAVTVDPLTASRFEVVRGPMSLLYGSSALGGVVNVIRDEVPTTLPEHVEGVASVNGTSVDRGGGIGGVVNGRAGRVALRAEGSGRHAGDLRTPLGTLANTGLDTYSASAGAAYIGSRGYAGAAYRYFDNDYGVPGGFVGGHDLGVTIQMRRHTARADAELRPASGPFASVRATAGYTDYSHEEIEAGGSLGTSFAQTVGQGDVIARHKALGPATEGAVGARYQYRDIATGGTLRTPSTYDNSAAAFIVEQFGRGPLKLQAGARYDWAHYVPYKKNAGILVGGQLIPTRPRTFGNVSGSLGALYDLGATGTALRGVQLGASVSRAYRTPDFNELYSNGPHLAAFSFDVGDPNNEAETGLGVDVFARLTRERLHGEAAFFRNRMNGYLYPRNTGDIGLQGNRPKFQFTGRDALLTGAEGSLEAHLTPTLVAEGTVSYVRGTFIGAVDPLPPDSAHGIYTSRPGSRYLPLMPPLNGHLALRYETAHAAGTNWFGGVSVRAGARQEKLGDFETPSAGYGLLDLEGGTRLLLGGRFHTVTLRVENALDQAWRNHLSRTKEVMPEAGRNVSLLYRVSF